ncbi:MAG TPA: DUF1800 family protein [Candidatus Acidoferrales bacterium]|nr:DUF1800 family protein [Candidatus Acidoferrales bacterium]
MPQHKFLAILALAALSIAGCTAGGNNGGPPPATVSVTVAPGAASVRAGDTQQFTATVTGTANTAVNWAVNGVAGGNATLGTITTAGLYAAPGALPAPNTISVTATSQQDTSKSAASTVTLLNPIPLITQSWPGFLGISPNVPVTIVITGSKFASGAQVLFGGTAFTTTFVSSTRLTATGVIPANTPATVQVVVRNPDPGGSDSAAATATVSNTLVVNQTAAARFLEQATFGPTPQLIDQVRYVGFQNFLNDQFTAPSSTFDDAVPDAQGQFFNPDTLQRRWWTNALYGPDQLRQRLAFALHKIWVVSWVTVNDSRAFVPYLRMHQNHALGNYRQIMENVTKDPSMGRFQDIANNDGAANRTASCNENYGRELMQLFTIGLWKLNPDGTFQGGVPTQAYDPVFTVEQNACAMTGWTYANAPGQNRDWPRRLPFYGAPLEAVESHHDTSAKRLIDDFPVPAGTSAAAELDLVLDNIFCHSNIAPFVSKLLIQQFVTSNPSPAYVQRVVTAFNGSAACTPGPGNNVPASRGDMRTVISAILLDPEARRGDTLPVTDGTVANDGKFKEPLLMMTNLLRFIGAQTDGSTLAARGSVMGQFLLFPPTVFSYFSPEYQIPGSPLLGPELNIQTTATTFQRINFINTFSFGSLGAGTTLNFAPFTSLAANPDAPGQLLDVLNGLMLGGRMSAAYRASLMSAISAVPAGATQNEQRARTAIYLIASSSQYNVQH